MKSILPAVAVAAVLPFGAACVVVDSQGHITREEKRFKVSGAPELHLTTFDGAIEIRAGDARTIVVEIEKRGPTEDAIAQLKIEAKQEGNRIDVEVKRPPAGDRMLFGIGRLTPTAKLIVTMPREGNVIARSGDGSIRVEHVRGTLRLRTGDGSIRATGVGGKISLVTGDGSVTLDDADGDLDVDTGDGSVSVAGRPGALRLHTGDGSITFRAEPGTKMSGDWSLTTGDGGVSVYLPSEFDAQIDAHTGDGRISSELDVARDGESDDRESRRRTLRGKLGNGGPALKIRTGDGSIRLKTT
jgi:hypothetical protein